MSTTYLIKIAPYMGTKKKFRGNIWCGFCPEDVQYGSEQTNRIRSTGDFKSVNIKMFDSLDEAKDAMRRIIDKTIRNGEFRYSGPQECSIQAIPFHTDKVVAAIEAPYKKDQNINLDDDVVGELMDEVTEFLYEYKDELEKKNA
jgi:hypothetical protein